MPAGKISVVINGVELSRYSPRPFDAELGRKWGILPGQFVAGYVGTLGLSHGLDNVLEAARRVEDPSIRFLLVGGGAEREALVERAARDGLANVVFVPSQPKESMPAFWSLCSVALVHLKNTPLFETVIPSKMFEAMGMGLPILLACPRGEASRILDDTDAGLWVPPEDPAALAASVLRLKEDAQLYGRLRKNSLAAAPSYTRERQAVEMMAALEQAVETPQRMVAPARA